MTRRYPMPRAAQPLIDDNGMPSRVWHEYLSGIEAASKRFASAQSDTTAADLAALKSDFNALLAKLRAAGLMET